MFDVVVLFYIYLRFDTTLIRANRVLLAEVLLSVEQITDSKSLVTYVAQEIRFGLLSEPGYVNIPKSAKFSSLPDHIQSQTNIF
jgi:hypothetical protein